MTRATLLVVTDKNVISSTEFNGDGYPDGYGVMYMKMLEETKSVEDFIKFIEKFNSKNFQYEGQLIYEEELSKHFNGKIKKDRIIDLEKSDYFSVYGSDWIFFKNLSSELIIIKSRDSKLLFLQPSKQIALSFGEASGHYTSVAQCIEEYEAELAEADVQEIISDKKQVKV